MTLIDYQNDVKYCDELLKFIHSEIGKINHSKDEIISLMKEHKRAVKYLNSSYVIASFQSDMNLNDYDLEKFKILKRIVAENFDTTKTIKRQLFCKIAYNHLKMKSNKIVIFLDIHLNTLYRYISDFEADIKRSGNKEKYIEFKKKYGFN